MTAREIRLTAIVCTYNPRSDLIARALRAIGAQTLAPAAYELVVVDNNSRPPLDRARLERLAGRTVNLVTQTRQGLTFARVAGIRAARAPLIVFIDDDNEIMPDFFEAALAIARAEPRLGMFGGIADGALEARIGPAKRKFLPFLGVRNLGDQVLTGAGDRWGNWEPIGAGLCVRRDIALAYADFVETTQSAGGLGRRGGALLSGEDSLFSRIGDRMGYQGGYRPALKLYHRITAPRLELRYLARLMEGHGRSYVLLENICGRKVEIVGPEESRKKLLSHFAYRLKGEGLATAAGMFFWDLGNFRQSRDQAAAGDLLDRFDAKAVADDA